MLASAYFWHRRNAHSNASDSISEHISPHLAGDEHIIVDYVDTPHRRPLDFILHVRRCVNKIRSHVAA